MTTHADKALTRIQDLLGSRYALQREIGRGGTSTVYLAHDPQNDQQVAIKVLQAAFVGSVDLQRFLREIQLASRLSHPKIVPMLDSGHVGEFPFFVMPYISGESLSHRLERERRLPISDAVRIAIDVTDALAYAHANDVVHRDIKPANIMLGENHAMVADFGIGKAITVTEESSLTRTGIVVGTPAYMSLEQAAGDADIDGRSDLFSLGVVLYEMLSGEAPFGGATIQAMIAARFTQPVPPLPGNMASPALDQVLGRAMARFREHRYATAEEFAAALREAAALPH
jgi:eukaryotic-like serine/threonine-protein kinase